MQGTWVDHTATGGAGALTLVAIAGSPTYANVFGTTGTRTVRYTVTNSAGTKLETGFGTITLSTLSLARDVPIEQFSGTTFVRTAIAAPLDFTADGTVNVRCTAMSSTEAPVAAAAGNSGSGQYGYGAIGNPMAYGGNINFTPRQCAGVMIYPFKWVGTRPIKRVAFYISSLNASASTLKVGMYEQTPTGGFNLVVDFTTSGAVNTGPGGVSGINTLLAPTNFPETYLPPGYYGLGLAPSNSACTLFGHANVTEEAGVLFGCNSSLDIISGIYAGGSGNTLSQSFGPGAGLVETNSGVPSFRFGYA